MSVTADTSQSPIAPFGPVEQSYGLPSSCPFCRHSSIALMRSVLKDGLNTVVTYTDKDMRYWIAWLHAYKHTCISYYYGHIPARTAGTEISKEKMNPPNFIVQCFLQTVYRYTHIYYDNCVSIIAYSDSSIQFLIFQEYGMVHRKWKHIKTSPIKTTDFFYMICGSSGKRLYEPFTISVSVCVWDKKKGNNCACKGRGECWKPIYVRMKHETL